MKKLKTNQEIQIEIKKVASKINKDFNGQKIDLIALNDSPKLLINDIVKHFKLSYECFELRFVHFKNRPPSNQVKIIKDLDFPVYGRNIILVDGIIISGTTHHYLSSYLMLGLPKSISILSIGIKPSYVKKTIPKTYRLFDFKDEMVEGYGFGSESIKIKKYLVDSNTIN